MQLHWGWAVLGALAVCAALFWWTRPDVESPQDSAGARSANADRAEGSAGATGPTLYRWVDAKGVVNITTEHPPAGRRFTIVRVNPDQNIVPMTVDSPASTSK